jgi:hypothetical protein
MKILINESQLEGVIKKYLERFYSDKIMDIEIEGSKITITLEGEPNWSTMAELESDIKNDLKSVFSGKNLQLEIKFEKEFEATIEFDGNDKTGYDVRLEKTMDNGEIFELEGELRQYSSGRADEWEFEPTYISDDDYYAENWEIIEEYILDRFVNK